MHRIVLRFADGGVFSYDYTEREEEDLRRALSFFRGKRVRSVEEQIYDPSLPRRYRYRPREDLLERARLYAERELADLPSASLAEAGAGD